MSVLEVRDLTVEFAGRGGPRFRAVNDVSFALHAGKTLALVGESGSGKSTVARVLARLITPTRGELLLDGERAGRHGQKLRAYRSQVQLVFQDPFASLNPAFRVAHHLERPLRIYGQPRHGVDAAVQQLLRSVNLVPPDVVAKRYPHELSGGQRQRVAIARALAPSPTVLLADEPVSMLDVSIRLEILNLLDTLKADRNLALLYITHDLATARHFSSEVMVMYAGEIVEHGPADEVILRPAHPYTQVLAAAVPNPAASHSQLGDARRDRRAARPAGARLEARADTGCTFRRRCPYAMDICATRPPAFDAGAGHVARCWLHDPAVSGTGPVTGGLGADARGGGAR
jgi:peptide/nickel transport system ATP-binding protein